MGRQAEALVPARRGTPPPRGGAFEFLGVNSADREPVSLATVDAELMRDALSRWFALGHAITIGRTSDGGAVAVSLLAGGSRRSQYFADLAMFEDFLVTLRDRSGAQQG